LPPDALARLGAALATLEQPLARDAGLGERLRDARRMYEPYVTALSRYLLQPLPAWLRDAPRRDNWEASMWGQVMRPGEADEET